LESKWRQNVWLYGLTGFWRGARWDLYPHPQLCARLAHPTLGDVLVLNKTGSTDCKALRITGDYRVDFYDELSLHTLGKYFPYGFPVEPDHPPG
jgi:hypothetical protein